MEFRWICGENRPSMNASDYTWHNVARFYFPGISDEDCGELLMSATAYPFSSVRYTCKQLHRKARQVIGVPQDDKVNAAIAIAHTELEKTWKRLEREKWECETD